MTATPNDGRISTSCGAPRRGWIFRALLSATALGATGCQQSATVGPVADKQEAEKITAAFTSASAASGGEDGAGPVSTGWATLKGRFVFAGDPPAMPPYNATKDMATCAPGGKAPPQEWLIVGDDGGLANVAIYARKVSRVHESAEPPADDVVFDQENCVFLSHVCPIVIGQTVTIKNSDPVGHNTNVQGQNGFNQTVPAGGSTPYEPQREESSPVKVTCSIHPWMLAYMLPRENGYVAVTGQDGAFELANLPAGETVEIQVWHESAPGGGVVVDGDVAKELKWSSKGRFKIKLEENETREIEIQVPASALAG